MSWSDLTAEQQQRVRRLVQQAHRLSPPERDGFLRQECQGDDALRREVEAQLKDTLPGGIAAQEGQRAAESHPPQAGHHEIIRLLGRGAMGEVWLARDRRLKRPVAIKFLAAQYLSSAEALERFRREALAVAALNHPSICTLFDIGEDQGRPYLVLEYLEGQTLRERLEKGRPAREEFLSWGEQIISAVAAAHAAGILNRDIKAANVFLTQAGQAKVLDFGLAKAVRGPEAASAAWQKLESSGDIPVAELLGSRRGALLGTPHYMSPEQTRRENLDFRSDVFSLGVLLYEMATGELPFQGATWQELSRAIQQEEPVPPRRRNPKLPRGLDRLILRALEKDPSRRYPNAGSLLEEWKRLRRPKAQWLLPVALAAALAVVYFLVRRPADLPPKPLDFGAVTVAPERELYPTIAPDGTIFAYAANPGGEWSIYVSRGTESGAQALPLPKPADDTQPAFSPDGQWIAFRSSRQGGGIFKVKLDGSGLQRLTDFGYHPSWSPDGRSLAVATEQTENAGGIASRGAIRVIDAAGANARQVIGDMSYQPAWSPGGYRIAFWKVSEGRKDIWTVQPDGRNAVAVTADDYVDWCPAWSPDGKFLYYSSERGGGMNLWVVGIDERSGKVRGRPAQVTTGAQAASFLAFSRNGSYALYVSSTAPINLYRADLDGSLQIQDAPYRITSGARSDLTPNVSPDGKRIVFVAEDPQQDLWVATAEGKGLKRLTNDVYKDMEPRWSPDASWIAFQSNRRRSYQVWKIRPDGTGLAVVSAHPDGDAVTPLWSPDGRMLAYSVLGSGVFGVDLSYPGSPRTPQLLAPVPAPATSFIGKSWSPDGTRIAGTLLGAAAEPMGVAVYNLVTKSDERVSDGAAPTWLADSRRLLVRVGEEIRIIDPASKSSQVLVPNTYAVQETFALDARNRILIFSGRRTEAETFDIWRMRFE